ncbi:MAG: DNA gyrase/topoisomerase IV subunit A, partial [Bacteroidales bacterium]|nr:DNA gyrase/topoisomerase IV subunit A [Bacteroidales bacterium]
MFEDDEKTPDQELTPDEAADAASYDESEETAAAGNGYKPHNDDDATDDKIHHLGGMYQNWFLDYASYVILERAVPHLADGLKPVQRRILHAMKVIDDGRYNKVANIVGQTMQYHPHGDASIGDALVQLGQKELLIDCQGNWGNILTGDSAAAPRYIEARLSKFALEVVFNNKITPWQLSYDGRKKEPINLPIKFPLLLAQGVEGIAVGLSSKILPHNFNELLDASIACLKGEPFELYPDFPTGGLIDVSKYHDGARGGVVKVRSRIDKIDQKSLRITDVPFGKTTDSLIESIRKAIEKGKIKIKSFDDFTSDHAEIVVHLMPGVSSDKTIDALYAFTDCEISISPNCCVIYDKKPHFLTVSEVLRRSAENTKELLRQELEVSKGELLEHLMTCSLEKIFIEERIYKGQEYEQAKDLDTALAYIDLRLEPFKKDFVREVTRDDLLRLEDIKMARIHKFNSQKAEEDILQTKKKIREVEKNLRHLTTYTIKWFEHLKEKYGADFVRHTEIRNFDSVDATKVIESNMKLWFNKTEGFIGTGLKQSESEFVCNCSEIDEILVIYKNGQYKVMKVDQKVYVGKDVLYLNVYRKNDNRTIYNVVYRDGKGGPHMIKRFAITSVMRDKVYDITQGKDGSRIAYFSANQNGEAEVIRVFIKSKLRNAKVVNFERDFAETPIKGRGVKGNLLTKADVQKIQLVSKG